MPCFTAPCTSCVLSCSSGLYSLAYLAIFLEQRPIASRVTLPARSVLLQQIPSLLVQLALVPLLAIQSEVLSASLAFRVVLPVLLQLSLPAYHALMDIFYTRPTTAACLFVLQAGTVPRQQLGAMPVFPPVLPA